MSRRVCDYELTSIGIEKPVGDIDGNPLLTLSGKTIDEQRKIDISALCADFFGITLQRRYLILKNELGFKKHTSYKCAFTVINRAAGDKSQ